MDKCVALLGTGSTQRYIFGSNRLQENSGASYLVVGRDGGVVFFFR